MQTARRCGAVAAFAVTLCASFEAPAAPSIADFAADSDFASPVLSPDGNRIAYVTRNQEGRVLMVFDLAKRERAVLMKATIDTFDLTRCNFKSDDRLLCAFTGTGFVSGEPFPVTRLVSIDPSGGGKPRLLIQNGNEGGSQFQDRILDWQVDDPRRVLIALAADRGAFPEVHSLDVYTGRMKFVQRSREPIVQWLTDRKGVVRFGYGHDAHGEQYITRASKDSPWRTLGTWDYGKTDFDVLGFGPVPDTLLVGARHNGRAAIFEMDLTEKSDRQLLFANSEVDVNEPLYWPSDHRIIGFSYETDRLHRKLFDLPAEHIYGAIDGALPNADNSILGASRDSMKVLVASSTDVRPTDYILIDIAGKSMTRLASANLALAQVSLAPMKPVRIKGPDGTMLPGYLTLPPGGSGKNLPMVMYPHGGPHARDSWGFDPMVQFMASRGYAVLQVNFRGSTGYGYEWYEAGLRNWGTVMVDDITAATKWAISQGIADPARTCIVGWSFGGYAALMSAVRESGLYRCAASIAGVADLRALKVEESRFYGGWQAIDYTLGSDIDELKAGSPLRAVERIKVPVLLVHGDDDIRVNVDHSRRMAHALEREHKKFELVIIKDGNHSLSRFEWRQTLLTKLEAFLAENLN